MKLKIIKKIFFFTIGVSLLWFAFKEIDLSQVLSILSDINYFYVIISFLVGFLSYVIRAIRWKLLLKSMGYSVKLSNSINVVSISYLSNLILPRAGEIVRCTTMSNVENIPVDKLLGTVILERIIDLFILIIILVSTFFIAKDNILNFFDEVLKIRNQYQDYNFILYVSIFLSIFVIISVGLFIIFRKKIFKTNLYKKTKKILIGIKAGLISIKNINNKTLFISYTFLIWVLYFLMNYIVFFSFEEMSNFSFSEGLILLVVGGLAMVVPIQGGIGSYHLSVKIALTFLGISEIVSISFATLVHTAQTLVALVFGGVSFIYLGLYTKKRN